jgi:hypothetical protein
LRIPNYHKPQQEQLAVVQARWVESTALLHQLEMSMGQGVTQPVLFSQQEQEEQRPKDHQQQQ